MAEVVRKDEPTDPTAGFKAAVKRYLSASGEANAMADTIDTNKKDLEYAAKIVRTHQVKLNDATSGMTTTSQNLRDPHLSEERRAEMRLSREKHSSEKTAAEAALVPAIKSESDLKVELAKRERELERLNAIAKECEEALDQSFDALLNEYSEIEDGFVQALEGHNVLIELQPGSELKSNRVTTARLLSPELQQRIALLLEHMTTRRIAEEMDTPTYLTRLSEFFERGRNRAKDFRDQEIPAARDVITETSERLSELDKSIAAAVNAFVSPAMTTKKKKWAAQNENRSRVVSGVLADAETVIDRFSQRLDVFIRQVCGRKNTERVSQISSKVSEVIENGNGVRWWPLLVAGLTTTFARVAIVPFASLYVVGISAYFLVATFVGTYFFSVWLGKRYRRDIMAIVRDHHRVVLKELFGSNLRTHEGFRITECRFEELDVRPSKFEPLKDGVHKEPKKLMENRNLLVIAVSALLAVAAQSWLNMEVARPEAGEFDQVAGEAGAQVSLIGTTIHGVDCKIVRGLLTRVDGDNYYVLAQSDLVENGWSRIFPQFFADAFPKSIVQTVEHRPGTEAFCDAVNDEPLPDPVITVAFGTFVGAGQTCEEPSCTGGSGEVTADLIAAIASLVSQVTAQVAAIERSIQQQVTLTEISDLMEQELMQVETAFGLGLGTVLDGQEALQANVATNQQTLAEMRARIQQLEVERMTPERLVALVGGLQAGPEIDLSLQLTLIVPEGPEEVTVEPFPQITSIIMPAAETNAETSTGGDAAGVPEQPPLWSYALYVNDVTSFEADDALLLPFFPVDVTGTGEDLERAFEAGLRALDEVEEQNGLELRYREGLLFYLQRLVTFIEAHVADGGHDLTLDVTGFATERWIAASTETRRNELNHALAEGRRLAVIKYLAETLDEAVLEHVWVTSANRGARCRSLGSVKEQITQWDHSNFPAFESESEMRTARAELIALNGLLSATDGTQDAELAEAEESDVDRAREFLARSVVVMARLGEEGCSQP